MISYLLRGSVMALLLACSVPAQAQRSEAGIRYMPTFASFRMKTSSGGTVKGTARYGYGVGAFVSFPIGTLFCIQEEAIYNTLSQQYKAQDVTQRVTLNYIDVPILLALNTGKKRTVNASIVAGLQAGISVGNSLFSSGNNSSQPVVLIKMGDLGFAYGAGLDVALNEAHSFRLGVGYRGVTGLIDISNHKQAVSGNSYNIIDQTTLQTYAAYVSLSLLF